MRTAASGEFWIVVGYEEARAVLADPRLSNDIRHSAEWADDGGNSIGLNTVQTDPPQHTRLRRLVAKDFTPRRVESLRPRVQRIADELVDTMLPQGKADLVEAFALPLPLAVICELLGVPETDRKTFHDWYLESTDFTRPEAAAAAAQTMTGYLAELIAAKRQHPGEDLLSALAGTMGDEEDRLSTEEMLGMAFLLLVAGYETAANLLSSGTLALLRHPEQLAALRADWSLLENAVEEMLRYEGPVETTAFRYAKEPVEIGGTVVGRGESVAVVPASASRDPARFAAADRFDIRRDARGHMAFGYGIHHCLGAPWLVCRPRGLPYAAGTVPRPGAGHRARRPRLAPQPDAARTAPAARHLRLTLPADAADASGRRAAAPSAGSSRTRSDRAGPGRTRPDQAGPGRAGSGRVSAVRAPSGAVPGSDSSRRGASPRRRAPGAAASGTRARRAPASGHDR
ncbi:cytochrome P450 [Streptomyces sp. NPDC008222]|uniref:cytochrome P450 family protein n=1 Tax=Streptomyces sp. NPDC008222 TaxID=3364820 RepID=UPI0036E57CC6